MIGARYTAAISMPASLCGVPIGNSLACAAKDMDKAALAASVAKNGVNFMSDPWCLGDGQAAPSGLDTKRESLLFA
ncbi:hypothetical protein D9M69_595850 [compost metagenome]